MSIRFTTFAWSLLFLAVAVTARGEEQPVDLGLRAPEGFVVTLFAGDELAHDIYSMTLDPQGHVVVAGPGYVKMLHDDDRDGRADRATLFSDSPKSGAHGMVFVENDLIATGDNLLMKLEDRDANGIADGKPIPLAIVNTPEHGANGLVQGPDGWIYLIAGNDAGIGAQLARTKTSPVKQPQAGTVVRFSPDFKTSEIFAHGFRNPYDLAFNENGQLFTVDSDGERDHYLPWYTPTRLFDIQQGMHHGWVQSGWQRSWSRPASYFDNVPRLVEIGRGSPTGVECYRHYAFPQRFRGSIFSCCWTLGTVYHFPLVREGASYISQKEIFLQTTGEVGFAPVDLAVGPQGEMYVAIGGRGTRGSVFCIRYTGKLSPEEQPPKAETELDQVLTAPQPLAAWSRAKWMPIAQKLGRDPFLTAAIGSQSASSRIRAIEVAVEVHGGLPDYIDDEEIASGSARVAARAFWAIGFRAEGRLQRSLRNSLAEGLLGADDPFAARAAWDALAFAPQPDKRLLDEPLQPLRRADPFAPQLSSPLWMFLSHADRRLIAARLATLSHLAANDLLQMPDEEFWCERLEYLKLLALAGKLHPAHFSRVVDVLGRRAIAPRAPKPTQLLEIFADNALGTRFPVSDDIPPTLAVDALRLLQLSLGDVRVEPTRPDVYAGYVANDPLRIPQADRIRAADALISAFPTPSDEVNRELARTVAMLEVEGDALKRWPVKVAERLTITSKLQDDLHYLIVLSRSSEERSEEVTTKTAGALAFLHYKMMYGNLVPSRNWPLRVGEVFVELCKRDPKLAEALAQHHDFGLPQHAMFATLMPESERAIAARRLLEKSKNWDEDTLWTGEMLRLVAALGDADSLDAVRAQWHDYSLRDVILEILAAKPDAADRELFVQALALPDANSVARAAAAIAALDAAGSPEETAAAISALRQQCSVRENRAARTALVMALKRLTGEAFETPEPEEAGTGETPVPLATERAYQPWFEWFAKAHPEAAKALDAAAALDGIALAERVANIDWAAGDAERGAMVFGARTCAKCHSGTSRLGPELTGVTGRWSHEDLLREIVDPHRNVAPQFHTTRLITRDGKVYQGVLVYDSPEGTLIQTAADTTLRITGDEIVRSTKTTQSLMPTGLLQGLTDGEIADLFTYLATLAPRREGDE